MKKFIIGLCMLAPMSAMAIDCNKAIAAIKKGIAYEAIDPTSVLVREIKIYSKPNTDNIYTVIGEVNGKNTFGGYTGFKLFGFSLVKRKDGTHETFGMLLIPKNDSDMSFFKTVFLDPIENGKLVCPK